MIIIVSAHLDMYMCAYLLERQSCIRMKLIFTDFHKISHFHLQQDTNQKIKRHQSVTVLV